MALSWLLHSAYAIVVGYPNEQKYGKQEEEVAKCLKQISKPDVKKMYPCGFEMPLHYPRYSKADYEKMEEWRLDLLLRQYGLKLDGTIDAKRAYAMGAFLWPDQL